MFRRKLKLILRLPSQLNRIKSIEPRFISTKQPASSTAASPELKDEDMEETYLPAQPQQIAVPVSTNQRWQALTTPKYVDLKQDKPVFHTCQTREEHEEYIRNNFFSYAPDADRLPPQEWRSVFQLFTRSKGMSVDNIQLMRTIVGADVPRLKQYNNDRLWNNDIKDQEFMADRVEALGHDLAAAHFLVYRGAKVKFHEHTNWVVQDANDDIDLPGHKTEGFHVRAIDVSNMKLLYEGLQNIERCDRLEQLILRGNKLVDNWFIDRICYQHHQSLVSLDISHCPLLTIGAITALVRLPLLRSLDVTGLSIPYLPLAALLLEEELPGLQVKGVTYAPSSTTQEVDGINRRLHTRAIHDPAVDV